MPARSGKDRGIPDECALCTQIERIVHPAVGAVGAQGARHGQLILQSSSRFGDKLGRNQTTTWRFWLCSERVNDPSRIVHACKDLVLAARHTVGPLRCVSRNLSTKLGGPPGPHPVRIPPDWKSSAGWAIRTAWSRSRCKLHSSREGRRGAGQSKLCRLGRAQGVEPRRLNAHPVW